MDKDKGYKPHKDEDWRKDDGYRWSIGDQRYGTFVGAAPPVADENKEQLGYKPQQKWKQGWWKPGRWSSSSSHEWSSGPWEWEGAQQGWSSQSQQWSAADWPDESIEDEKLAIADADDEPPKAAGADEGGEKSEEFQ